MSKCNMDCFHCVYDDCIEGTYKQRYESVDKRERQRAYQRRRRAEALAQGLCGNCHKREAVNGTLCEVCRQRAKASRLRVDISKRKESWKMSEQARPFVEALIKCGYSDSMVYSGRWAVDDFFSRFDEVTPENMEAWKRYLLERNVRKTANGKLSSMNQYCDFINKPECKVEYNPKGKRKRDELLRLAENNAAGASISKV